MHDSQHIGSININLIRFYHPSNWQIFLPVNRGFHLGGSNELTQKNDLHTSPNSKVRGANMGPIRGRQDPGGPHVGPMNFAIWVTAPTAKSLRTINHQGYNIFLYIYIKLNDIHSAIWKKKQPKNTHQVFLHIETFADFIDYRKYVGC